MEQLTANDVLDIIGKRAQWRRENGESDMRNILGTVSLIRSEMQKGVSRDEIIAGFAESKG